MPKIFESFVKYSGDFEFSLFLDLWLDKSANMPPFKEMFTKDYPAKFNFPNIDERKIHRPYRPTKEEFNEWLDYTDDINENLAEFKTIREHFEKYSDKPAFADFDAHCLLDDLRMAMEHSAAIVERYRRQIGFTRIDMDKITPIISAIMELNNKADPCPCGSGLKYKKCCGKIVN